MQKGSSTRPKGQKVRTVVALLVLLAMVMGFIAPLMWVIFAY